ncbi:hypothetical protein ACFFP0_20870 [Rhizobium puerariae]|uniref:Uncharacterized protein n=1 Tax=Rhizobium puerariae TaxID=1585791 RepID=A0ABV6APQ1_9HYPH
MSIGVASLIAIALTFIAPVVCPVVLDIQKFEGAFFASWAAGVALFALVGLIVAIASVSRPDRDPFDSRARIFLQRQSGGHIDYMVDKLRDTIEPYVDYTRKKLIVEEWREDHGKFKIRHETKSVLRGFMDDVPAKFPAKLNYLAKCDPPPGGQKPCVSYIRVNGEDVHHFAEFDREFLYDFEGAAPKYGQCEVEHVMTYWIESANEQNRHKPIRFTRALDVVVENKDRKHSIMVRIEAGAKPQDILLKPGDERTVIQLFERRPDDYVYDFRILPA